MFLEEEYLCCVTVLGQIFEKVYESFILSLKQNDGIDIPMPSKYYIINSDNTQKLSVSGDNTPKLLINPVSAQRNIC